MAYYSSEDVFTSVQATDVYRLIKLYSRNEEFTNYIANVASDPFRTTSFLRHVEVLDNAFRNKLATKDVSEICLEDFKCKEERGILNQLPNLLKTYVLKSDYEFGNNEESDRDFCYLVYRIIRAGNTFKSYRHFETAFLKAGSLSFMYKRLEKEFIAEDSSNDSEETEKESEI